MTKTSAASFSHFIVWPPSYQRAAVFPSCVCGLGLSGGDGDAAFEDEVDVVADSFRASIIFRLPAPTFMYHGPALEVNPFAYQGMKGTRLNCGGIVQILRSYLHFHPVSQHPGGKAGVIAFL